LKQPFEETYCKSRNNVHRADDDMMKYDGGGGSDDDDNCDKN
jgi:hypothetical protein